MWCVNPMVVDTWKADPYPGYADCPEGVEGDEDDDKVEDQIPSYPPREKRTSLSRSASCNRINLPLPSRKPKRSLSTSGTQRPEVRKRTPAEVTSDNLDQEIPKEKEKLKRSNSVLTRIARQYSFTRSKRTSSSTNNMSSAQASDDTTTTVTKGKTPRRRRNKNNTKKDAKTNLTAGKISHPTRLELPKNNQGRIPSPLLMTVGNSHLNGDLISSPDSCPSSPAHFSNKASFSIAPPTPTETNPAGSSDRGFNPQRATSPISADESPFPSPPLDDKSYDSGRMSLSSFRSFGSSGGRPTSLSSVTSSLSSRTSRGSDYFSSASSTDQQHQVTSYRLGMQTVLPNLDESDSVDRLVLDPDGTEEGKESKNNAGKSGRSAFVAHDRNNRNLNDVDHLAPVANLAMVDNPDLSYVDRVILELVETERMYVRSLRDILTGYLAVIRSTPELNIQLNDVDDLFGNIRDIYDFNRNLLVELEECYGEPRRVAECFVAKDGDFKVYTEYCTNYPSSVAAMTRCMKNPNLVDFFKEQQDDLRHTLPLGSYLLKPVQRILKYHLLLQELVKHCDKGKEGYQTIQNALQTMTRVARHINEMKRKHEDAVHLQEIQSLLMNWQGNELTTYGELILENEMRMQGAKNERQVFLFEKMILITKRREDGYLVCKANIMCANLVLLESIPNTPFGFQIQPFAENAACINSGVQQQANGPPDATRIQRYILLAPSQEEKSLWTYHIKRLIIETMCAAVPLEAKKSIMRMRPVRDGDGDGDSEEDRMRKKSKNRYPTSAILGNPQSTKSPLSRFTSASNSTTNVQSKTRRRSDSMSRKSLHKRALQKRSNEIESSDDISADSGPNTPSGLKVAGKFSFPSFRQSTRSSGVQHANKPTTTQAQSKTTQLKTTNSNGAKKSTVKEGESKKASGTTPNQNGEVVKRHHNSVIYRRHKRRTSQPITITEKRLSMKIEDDGDGEKKKNDDDVIDDDDLMNFNPLTARESVSWDIQIVEAVFERFKNEGSSPVSPSVNENSEELDSPYLTVSSEVAPSPLMRLDSDRRKSRIVVVPSSDSSEEEMERKKKSSGLPAVVRRRKSKSGQSHRTSGVVYTLSQELAVESDSGLNETKAILRKVVHASESARKSLVIHESDTEAETARILKEKANTVRRKTSVKRRERDARRKNAPESSPSKFKEETNGNRRGSLYDNLDDVVAKSDVIRAAVTSSVQSMSTQTISMVDSSTKTTTATVQSNSATWISATSTNDVISANSNNNNNKLMMSPEGKRHFTEKDMKHIPSGKVRGLINRMWNSPNAEPKSPTRIASASRKAPVTSPTFSNHKNKFSFEPKSPTGVVSPIMWSAPNTKVANSKSNHNNNHKNTKSTVPATFPRQKSDPSNHRIITTASLPLTITSSSSSESDDESGPTIVQRVKRLSIHERGISEEAEDPKTVQQNPALYLRRTFSHDDSNSNTRRSTNLFLEARMSGEFAGDPESGFKKTDKSPGISDQGKQDESFSFKGVEEDIADSKHYLFEKLCLAPPGESKITDQMSEEFEHVCSDLESNIRLSSMDSQTFSASDDDSFLMARREKPLRREFSPLVPKQDIAKFAEAGRTNETVKNVSKPGETVAEVPKIYGTKATENTSGLRKYGPYGRNILPNRSDSIRSTRSEVMTPRLSVANPDTRGRSQFQRNKNSYRLPSKDMQAIPQSNVARLAKQFSEICKNPEKLAPSPPRRSRSVGGAERQRSRIQAREEKKKTETEQNEKKESPERENKLKSASVTNFSTPRSRETPTRPGRAREKYFKKAAVKVEEMFVCETIDHSRKLQTFNTVSSPEPDVTHTEDDVFQTSPNSPETTEDRKKRSLVEMFAANPRKASEIENENPHSEHSTVPQNTVRDSPGVDESADCEKMIENARPSTPSVRVFLVPSSNETGGRGNLEPRVLNLSPTGSDSISHPPLEKRKSWTKLSTESSDKHTRTRLRSSSLTRNRRRAILASDV